ncbi:EF-P lysine aminoacylase GenX [Alphaproteobacteria bacterium]|nr:EF-P lysine aminoacylase GenX [Alphaproteobacteria bacterium]
MTAEIRRFFAREGFTEVETPALQHAPGCEVHLAAFSTEFADPYGRAGRTYWLHTSPEFAMKKLLAAGMEKIFTLPHCFRNAECSDRHSPEFTMLEWYRAGADYHAIMADTVALVRGCFAACGVEAARHGQMSCLVACEWEKLTVAEAFLKYAGMDIMATIDSPDNPDPDPASIRAEAARIGVSYTESDRWEDIYFKIMLDRIEPYLGQGRPTFLCEYPAQMAALARRKPSDRRVAERFELYMAGLEVANAFSELTDPAEQRARMESDMAAKARLYGSAWPVDEDFLAAIAHGLPETGGIALGVDRLAMLITAAPKITDILWSPVAG